jgi:hypothetical protein
MLIRGRATLVDGSDRRGTKNTQGHKILKLSIPIGTLSTQQLGLLSQYAAGGQDVDFSIGLSPFIGNGNKQLELDDVLDGEGPPAGKRGSAAREERARPLKEEYCRSCGLLIGEDPEARFYTPLAGPPQPMHGACADRTGQEVETAAGNTDTDWKSLTSADTAASNEDSQSDAPIGDGPMPAPPADVAPITSPIRKRGGGSVQVVR